MKRRVRISTRENIGHDARVMARVVCRVFAIHRTYYEQAGARVGARTWVVTHIPSGLAFYKFYPSEARAVRAAREFAALPLDWAAVRTPKDVPKAVSRRCIRILKAHRAEAAGVGR